jgi:hypothetical protein
MNERTRNSLRHKASDSLCRRRFLVLSFLLYQKISVPQSAWAGDSAGKVVFNSTIKKLTDVDGAIPLTQTPTKDREMASES